MRFLYLLFVVVFLVACKTDNKQPSDNFIEAYIEMRVATEHFGKRPEAGLARAQVLKKYGFTAESFSTEADRLRSNYGLWQEYGKRVTARLDTLVLSGQAKQDADKTKKSEADSKAKGN